MTQHYVGTKVVLAWNQTKDNQSGYGVKYEDGYTSWSPKETFEKAYLPLGNLSDQVPYKARMIAEKAQLDQNITKLEVFLGMNPIISAESKELLTEQLEYMREYRRVLGARILL